MALNYVQLVLDLADGEGNPLTQGTVILTPTAQSADVADHLTVTQQPIVVRLFNNPTPTVRILATDNTSLTPSTWRWQIAGTYAGAPPAATYAISFASGATQYLSQLTPGSLTTLPCDPSKADPGGFLDHRFPPRRGLWKPDGNPL